MLQLYSEFCSKTSGETDKPENLFYAPAEPIQLKWNGIKNANSYEVLVQELNNNIILKDTTNDTTYALPQIDSGVYYFWKVRHLYNIQPENIHKNGVSEQKPKY